MNLGLDEPLALLIDKEIANGVLFRERFYTIC